MEVVIPLAMLAIGLIIGFFVARFMYTKEGAVKANEAAEKPLRNCYHSSLSTIFFR